MEVSDWVMAIGVVIYLLSCVVGMAALLGLIVGIEMSGIALVAAVVGALIGGGMSVGAASVSSNK